MKFNIVQITQQKQVYYLTHDPLRTLYYSLEDLGHDVVVSRDAFSKDRINIIAMGFRLSIPQIQSVIKQKLPYVVYQTEIFSELGLNYSPTHPAKIFQDAQERYLELIRNATMVWECFDFNQRYLQSIGIESSLIYHGYIPDLEGRPKKKEPDVDACFFGTLTEYRRNILKELAKQGVNAKYLYLEPPFMRDDLLRRSKINLSMRANTDTMPHLPHFRVLTGLYQNTMTVSEQAIGQGWLSNMVDLVEPENFVSHVVRILEEDTYLDKVEEYRNTFKAMPMVDFMRDLINTLETKL